MKKPKPQKIALFVAKMGEFWWICGDEEDGPYGPYSSRPEAVEEKRGLVKSNPEMFKHRRRVK